MAFRQWFDVGYASTSKQRSAHLRVGLANPRSPYGVAKSKAEFAAIAIFSASTKPIARSAGRSAVASAAYRAGVELVDQRTGLIHDYTRRGGVVSAEVILADGGSADRSVLWNAAEVAERRKDSRTAREWLVALPAELAAPERSALARAFGIELAERYGVAVDIAVHAPDRDGDQRNHHAHLLTTTRTVTRAGEGLVLGKKVALELGDGDRAKAGIAGRSADDITQLRDRWAQLANAALERAGSVARIDSRSLAAQGIDRAPTKHLGPMASDMERRGKLSDRGDGNRQIHAGNVERGRLTAQILDFTLERVRIEGVLDTARLDGMPTPALRAEVQRRESATLEATAERHPQIAPLIATWRRAQRGADWCAKRLQAIGQRVASHLVERGKASGVMTAVQRFALRAGAAFGAVKASQDWLGQQARMKARTKRVLALRQQQAAAVAGRVRELADVLRPAIEEQRAAATRSHARAVDVLAGRERANAQKREQDRAEIQRKVDAQRNAQRACWGQWKGPSR